ncbi:MAG: hypothetical protein KC733_12440 [Candidatus Omnitrophica bacterium]|nr:hypothetical protein [Candidatus Omnitrophota bacterium]
MTLKEATIEETEEGKSIKLNGWFRWVVGGLATALWGILILALINIANNVIANDKSSRDRDDEIKTIALENRANYQRVDTKLDFIIENQREFKDILKRTAPYERKR